MKTILLLLIKIYWALIPAQKRRSCIFRESCSRYVYRQLKTLGLSKGREAFHFRIANCRHGYQLFDDPISGKRSMLLPAGQQIEADEIAERLLFI